MRAEARKSNAVSQLGTKINKSEGNHAEWLSARGFKTGRRIGGVGIAFRIACQQEALCLELGNKSGGFLAARTA
jgi:hypothetical protein